MHIAENPANSSLREITQQLLPEPAAYANLFGVDFDRGIDTVETRSVETTTLDALVAGTEDQPALPPPDFLSLDTQGSEYEILLGAHNSLTGVCGVIAETIYAEGYRGQKRFQEIHDLLNGEGFAFVRFSKFHEIHGVRAPIGLRSGGQVAYGEALFLRRPWTVDARSKDQLKKLCFFSVVYDQLEYAIACLDRLTDDDFERHSQSAYESLVTDLQGAYARSPKVMPPAFSQILRREQTHEYARTPVEHWGEIFDYSAFVDPPYLSELRRLQHKENTEVEEVLCKYGFEVLAEKVNFLRRHHSYQAEKAISESRAMREAKTVSSGS